MEKRAIKRILCGALAVMMVLSFVAGNGLLTYAAEGEMGSAAEYDHSEEIFADESRETDGEAPGADEETPKPDEAPGADEETPKPDGEAPETPGETVGPLGADITLMSGDEEPDLYYTMEGQVLLWDWHSRNEAVYPDVGARPGGHLPLDIMVDNTDFGVHMTDENGYFTCRILKSALEQYPDDKHFWSDISLPGYRHLYWPEHQPYTIGELRQGTPVVVMIEQGGWADVEIHFDHLPPQPILPQSNARIGVLAYLDDQGGNGLQLIDYSYMREANHWEGVYRFTIPFLEAQNHKFAFTYYDESDLKKYDWEYNAAIYEAGIFQYYDGISGASTLDDALFVTVPLPEQGEQHIQPIPLNTVGWAGDRGHADKDIYSPTVSIPLFPAVDIPASGALTLHFDEPMNISHCGTIKLTSAVDEHILDAGIWSEDKMRFEVHYSDLTAGRLYTVTVSDFEDLAGNKMDTDVRHSFSVAGGYVERTLKDDDTNISIAGNITPDATVDSLRGYAHDEGTDSACDAIHDAQSAGLLLALHDISVSGGSFIAPLTITIPIPPEYNDREVSILHCKNGTLETQTAIVQGGKAVFQLDSLSPIGVVLPGTLAAGEVTVHLSAPGGLQAAVEACGTAPEDIAKLTATGIINTGDLDYIWNYGAATKTALTGLRELDLSGARLHGTDVLPENQFNGCPLTVLKLPSGIALLGNYAFNNCNNLALYLYRDRPVRTQIFTFDLVPCTVTLYVPNSILNVYQTHLEWSYFKGTLVGIDVVNTQVPQITEQPRSVVFPQGKPYPLSVSANVSDGGTLSYQWYKGYGQEEPIPGATGATCALPDNLAAGSHFYSVTITNTNNAVNGYKTAAVEFPLIVIEVVSADDFYINVTATGLDTLKVGRAVSDAKIVYTLRQYGGIYTEPITAGEFTVSGLPAGLHAGTAVRVDDKTVEIPVTGAPTAHSATGAALVPSNITHSVQGMQWVTIVPSGTIAAGPVAKGDGGALSGPPTISGTPSVAAGITVNPVTNTGATGQAVEYALSQTSGTAPATGWQGGTTFALLSGGTYYVYARTAESANYQAGTPLQSAAIAITADSAQTPAVTTEPADANIAPGGTHTLSVAANVTDGGTLSYQWYKDGISLAGATAASYTTPDTLAVGAHAYHVVVTNTNPSANINKTAWVQSRTALVNVSPALAYPITVQAVGGGTANASASSAAQGAQITLTAAADSGHRFKEWQVVAGGVTIADNKFIMPAQGVVIKAVFEPIPVITYAVTVHNGTAAPASAAQGETVTVTAGAAPGGQRFKEWSFAPAVPFTDGTGKTDAAAKFTMPAQGVTATATYEALPPSNYSITVLNDGNGAANAGTNSAQQGAEITLSATPNSGYRFKQWQVVAGGITVAGNKFTMPAQNVTIKAVFEQIRYTVSVNGGYGAATGAGTYLPGDTVTIRAGSRNSYTFAGWTTPDGVTFAGAGSPTTTFTMPAQNVRVTANWNYKSGSGSSGSGGGGSGGGGSGGSSGGATTGIDSASVPLSTVLTVDALAAKAALAAMQAGSPRALIGHAGMILVQRDAWPVFGRTAVSVDTMSGSAVQVRIYIDSPDKLTQNAYVSGWVKGNSVDKVQGIFAKWFKNKIRVIHLDYPDPWGQTVRIAAKVDLAGMDTAKLCFYSYNKEKNAYIPIANPKYRIDSNGYLHFYTHLAGDIVISEGPLERK